MEFRNLLDKIFGKKREPPVTTTFRLLNGNSAWFAPWNGNIYNDDTVRACIDTIARHFAKLKAVHISKKDGHRTVLNDSLSRLLSYRANEFMSSYDFFYKIVSQLYTYNNVFVYIKQGKRGHILGLYCLDYSSVELRQDKDNRIYVLFDFGSKREVVPYENIIHFRRHFNLNEIYGEDTYSIFKNPLSVLKAAKNSIAIAISNSGILRGILKFTGVLHPEDLKKKHDSFVETYVSQSENGSSIATIDNTAEYQELKADYTVADSSQLDTARNDIYRLFGISDKIVQGDFTEEEYISFYEHVIEPLIVQFSQEFTEKLLTEKEKSHGEEIYFESNRLNYASTQTKVSMMQYLGQQGILTINEVRELFGWAPIADGDERLVSLNYVKSQHQDEYQQVAEKGDEELE